MANINDLNEAFKKIIDDDIESFGAEHRIDAQLLVLFQIARDLKKLTGQASTQPRKRWYEFWKVS